MSNATAEARSRANKAAATTQAPPPDQDVRTVAQAIRDLTQPLIESAPVHAATLLEMAGEHLDSLIAGTSSHGEGANAMYRIAALLSGAVLQSRADEPDEAARNDAIEQAFDLADSASLSDGFGQPFCVATAAGVRAGRAAGLPPRRALLPAAQASARATSDAAQTSDADERRELARQCSFEISKLAGAVKTLTAGEEDRPVFHGIMGRIEQLAEIEFYLMRLHGETDEVVGSPPLRALAALYEGRCS